MQLWKEAGELEDLSSLAGRLREVSVCIVIVNDTTRESIPKALNVVTF